MPRFKIMKKTFNIKRQRDLSKKLELVQWKDELTELSAKTGVDLQQVCDYLGLSYHRDIGFFAKIPRRRNTLIGIGMAYRLPLEEINRWLMHYGGHAKLYSRNVKEDLVWIFLISRNHEDRESNINYYRLFETCVGVVDDIYQQYWIDATGQQLDTSELEQALRGLPYDPALTGLKGFVIDHVETFQTAYIRPRKLLDQYTSNILRTRCGMERSGSLELNSLRGYLDDSMINFLSGSSDTIHVLNMKTGKRTSRVKAIPKRKKTHIAMCLALGMTTADIDEYLQMMGYGSMDAEDPDERILIKMLDAWEKSHPLQRQYKDCFIANTREPDMDQKDEIQAVRDMLRLRQDLKEEYVKRGEQFAYSNE